VLHSQSQATQVAERVRGHDPAPICGLAAWVRHAAPDANMVVILFGDI
jgi:hypothetical protein